MLIIAGLPLMFMELSLGDQRKKSMELRFVKRTVCIIMYRYISFFILQDNTLVSDRWRLTSSFVLCFVA